MCIDMRDEQLEYIGGEDVTVSINDLGDLVIMPCQRRINALLPTWKENHLSEKQIYAVIEDREENSIIEALTSLGMPTAAHEWLNRGHSVVFTTLSFDALDQYMYTYNGIMG